MEQNNSGDLIKIQISNLLKFSSSFAGVEVFLLVSSKYVKLNYSSDQFVEILRKLQQREVTEVFINPADCTRVLEQIKAAMSPKTFYDPKTVDEERMEIVDKAHSTVKSVISQIGVCPSTVRLLKEVNTKAMTMLTESPSIFTFVQKFKKHCSEEFMQTTLTSYLMSRMIDHFDWKSDQVKEKGALASLLCDILLEKEDFQALRVAQKEGAILTEKILNHPSAVADKLRSRRGLIPQETITIIEQHHELPSGKGYPLGITGNRFNQLSSIFILSQQFIEHLHLMDFDYNKRSEILERLKVTYGCKSFEKSFDALMSVVNAA